MLASKAKSYRLRMHGIGNGWHIGRPTYLADCKAMRHRSMCRNRYAGQVRADLIRSSAAGDGSYVTLSRDEWQVFIAGVKDGDFDSL